MDELEGMFYVLADEFSFYQLHFQKGDFRLIIEADKTFEGDDLKKVLEEAIKYRDENL
ncbi:hypothetical protein [Aliarcobacter butzleri]|uniref:hypothetical protein n=1 Tax=Aliarcobacter butzleri TaxID=28197 RepID=UPI00263D61ED|nr:hypothetical protein [Aliarcobacter butzleri]MDN5049786.1 hypothetical protein [Aliarcobacter butzleri]MDN5056897.1 hypothetical protein [Aliarcobacter butzleri]